MTDGAPAPGPEAGDPGRLIIVGPGRVGQSLAAALSGAGWPVTVRGRSEEPPSFLTRRSGVRYGRGIPDTLLAAEPFPTLVFCVPDDQLPGVARRWAAELAAPVAGPGSRGGGDPGADVDDGEPPRTDNAHLATSPDASGPPAVALHTSGVHGGGVLAPLRDAGWPAAAWHPLTAVAAPRADAFRGVTFALEGDPTALERARSLTYAVGGRPVGLEAGAHARYHAAAVFASNFLLACLSVAGRELEAATGGDGDVEDLLPLARAALENVAEADLAAGATGPLTRGDVGTVRRHLEALPEASAELYRRLARELLAVVEGRLTPQAAEELRRMLEEGP